MFALLSSVSHVYSIDNLGSFNTLNGVKLGECVLSSRAILTTGVLGAILKYTWLELTTKITTLVVVMVTTIRNLLRRTAFVLGCTDPRG